METSVGDPAKVLNPCRGCKAYTAYMGAAASAAWRGVSLRCNRMGAQAPCAPGSPMRPAKPPAQRSGISATNRSYRADPFMFELKMTTLPSGLGLPQGMAKYTGLTE